MKAIPTIITRPMTKSTIEIFDFLLKIGLKKLVNNAVEERQTKATEMVDVLMEW